MKTWFNSTGVLKYSPDRLVLKVDPEIAIFYRSLIPRWISLNPPRHPPHISIVREEHIPSHLWGKYEGENVKFQYSNLIEWDEIYFWLPTVAERFKEIREEMGLSREPPWHNAFHITIGNTKGL